MSLVGIAGASAADAGTAQTQFGNSHTVQKHVKTHVKHYKFINNSNKAHKKTVKKLKTVKKSNSSKNFTTQNRNKINSSKFYASAGSYKKVRRSTSANASSINALACSLTRGTSSQYQKGTRVFNWVRDHVGYRFYRNTKYGASGTLKYRTGNCADQAHLVVALARSSGLTARYVHAKTHFRSGHVYGHVWAQVRANGKWYTADPTSNRNSFGVAKNWNSARIIGIHNNLPL
jgi:hypothetical protein